MSCRLDQGKAARVSHLGETLRGHRSGMTSSKCLKHDQVFCKLSESALYLAQTSVGFSYSAQAQS